VVFGWEPLSFSQKGNYLSPQKGNFTGFEVWDRFRLFFFGKKHKKKQEVTGRETAGEPG